MKAAFLLDTDILIDVLRKNIQAESFLKKHIGTVFVSVISLTELYAGVRGPREIKSVEALLMSIEGVYDVTAQIAQRAGEYRNRYGKSHNTGVVDAIIAATAEVHEMRLVSLNKKHFPMCSSLLVPYKKS